MIHTSGSTAGMRDREGGLPQNPPRLTGTNASAPHTTHEAHLRALAEAVFGLFTAAEQPLVPSAAPIH